MAQVQGERITAKYIVTARHKLSSITVSATSASEALKQVEIHEAQGWTVTVLDDTSGERALDELKREAANDRRLR